MNKKKIIKNEQAPQPIGPYSQAVLVNGFLYISGQVALDGEGTFHNQDIEQETHQVMKNLESILLEAGMDFSHVVKCSIFVKDMNHFQTINEIYGSYFYSEPPARETVEVSRLPKDAGVEISCIACQTQKDYMN